MANTQIQTRTICSETISKCIQLACGFGNAAKSSQSSNKSI